MPPVDERFGIPQFVRVYAKLRYSLARSTYVADDTYQWEFGMMTGASEINRARNAAVIIGAVGPARREQRMSIRRASRMLNAYCIAKIVDASHRGSFACSHNAGS